MGSTLEHGIYLPSEGEKNCYQGLAGNWNKVDGALGDVAGLKQLIESKFTKEIVTELPTEDINPFCIYMILKTDPETDNIYDEWVYINNSWEYLGNTKVDMTQYYTKQEVNQLPAVASGVTSTKVGNYDTHIANGDIHVTANDKSKWNTVALIKQLRLVNTQVGSSTTIAFANIDDTNGIKVGDKCMDLDAKLFEITAVDTTNETVTVGSALIDLALDANVMHLSGNETVAGIKSFADNTFIKSLNFTNEVPSPSSSSSSIMPIITTITYGDSSPSVQARLNLRVTANGDKHFYPHENNQYSLGVPLRRWSSFFGYFVNLGGVYLGNEASTNQRTNLYLLANRDTDGQSGCYVTRYRQNKAQGALAFSEQQQIGIDFLENSVRTTNIFNIVATDWTNDVPGRILINSGIANNSFGSVTRKCLINELNPGALSFPDLSAGLDISGYLDTSQSSSNTYTPVVDGWISVKGRSLSGTLGIVITQNDMSQLGYTVLDLNSADRLSSCALPVRAGVPVTILLKSVTSIDSAKFFPCQGNV